MQVVLCLLFYLASGLAATLENGSACEALEAAVPGKVAYPGTTGYSISNNYWSSRQSDLAPPCFVRPTSATEVSTILKLLSEERIPFTVKSGGHATFETGSSIRHGVTIDLGDMNDIAVSSDRSTVSIGPGLRWYDVALALDPKGLAVVGARQPDVGVSGFLLGGGISFLSGRRGWGCDNVQNFQVVLASGEIVNASPTEHTDLFWALRGGGGASFGIVTRFDVNAYDQGDVWAKITTWPGTETYDVLITFVIIAREVLHNDRDAHLLVTLDFLDPNAPTISTIAVHLDHTNPADGLFDTFEGLARLPRQVRNDTYVTNMSTVLGLTKDAYGLRKTMWPTMIRDYYSSGERLRTIVRLCTEYALELKAAAEAKGTVVQPMVVFQSVTNPTLEIMKTNGGNPLGLEPGEFPLFLITVTVSWEDRALDCLIEKRSGELIAAIDEVAEEEGVGHKFTYLNYAAKNQEVFPTYGEENHQRLRDIAEQYDPDGVLKDLWEGYFKVY